jgi:hypothetical protein
VANSAAAAAARNTDGRASEVCWEVCIGESCSNKCRNRTASSRCEAGCSALDEVCPWAGSGFRRIALRILAVLPSWGLPAL